MFQKKTVFRLIALLALPALLAAAEGYLQWRNRAKTAARGLLVLTEPDEYLGYRHKRNSLTPDGLAVINAEGLRGDSLHVSTTPGRPRIVLIGNSCAFGAGCRDTEIFPVLLERKLRDAGAESALVFNCGVGGYNSNQCKLYLERELGRYSPDMLIVYCGWNDMVAASWPFYVENLQLGPKMHPEPGALTKAMGIMEQSRLFWSGRSRWRNFSNRYLRSDAGTDTWNQAYLDNYRRNLEAMRMWAEEKHVKIYFCLLPFDPGRFPSRYSADGFEYTQEGYLKMYAAFQGIIRDIGGDNVIDLPSAIAGVEHDTEVIYDYNHLGTKGHRLIADKIFDTAILLMISCRSW